ncbi:MAG: cation:proton antiporter [Thermodesulfobacteriota bacterium]
MDPLPSDPLFTLGLLLIAGSLAGTAAHHFGIPRISGYILTGLLLSPSVSGLLPAAQVESLFAFTSQMALAVIAYSIGGSLQMKKMRNLGGAILSITLCQGLGAFACTCLAVSIASPLLSFAGNGSAVPLASIILVLGAISVATAPAATLALVHELRSRGPLTTTLLGVVALDDGLCIVIFSAALTIAGHLGGIATAGGSMFWRGILEVAGALALGLSAGFFLRLCLSPGKRADINLLFTLGAVFLVNSLADYLRISPLLANMAMGLFIINGMSHADDLFHQLDLFEELVFCLFFSLAAAHFNIAVLQSSALLGAILLLGRFAGKLAGSYLGGILSGAPGHVRRYLGITLLPQAGLSLGLIFLARPILTPEIFEVLLSAMLAAIIMNEIVSPPLVKWALHRAGETHPEE